MGMRAAGLGAVMATLAIVGLHWPLDTHAIDGLALFLALTACVYPGALLAQKARRQTTLAEIGMGSAVFASAWIGLTHHPIFLAVGYAGHGVWDWLHHTDRIATRTSRWFPPACAAFDIVVAAGVIWLIV